MWTYKRFISILNRYVHIHAYTEGCMIEAYTIDEAINCCTTYIQDKCDWIARPSARRQNLRDGLHEEESTH
jgi:hypothetical protein